MTSKLQLLQKQAKQPLLESKKNMKLNTQFVTRLFKSFGKKAIYLGMQIDNNMSMII